MIGIIIMILQIYINLIYLFIFILFIKLIFLFCNVKLKVNHSNK